MLPDSLDGSSSFVSHHDRRNAAARRSIIAVHITAADSASCNADQDFIWAGRRHRGVCHFQVTVLRQEQSFHFAAFTCHSEGATIPLPSRMVRI